MGERQGVVDWGADEGGGDTFGGGMTRGVVVVVVVVQRTGAGARTGREW